MRQVRVVAASRLHFGLLDLGGATLRRYGGSGVALDAFHTDVTAVPARRDEIVGLHDSDQRAVEQIHGALSRLRGRHAIGAARITIAAKAPPHIGLGSKTSLILSILKAVSVLNESAPDEVELALSSGRGGASGVGVHTFRCGGFVADAGHAANFGAPFVPSSVQIPQSVPVLIAKHHVPREWRFHLFRARAVSRMTHEEERAFFQAYTPVSKEEVLAGLAAVYHGVVPAIASADLALLGDALRELHSCGFKRSELIARPETHALYDAVRQETALPTGLSSLGPMLYAVSLAGDHTADRMIESVCDDLGAVYAGSFRAAEKGNEVSVDDAPSIS